MNTLSILEEIYIINAYDGRSFIKEDHSHRLRSNDPTRVAVLLADKDRGTQFEPFYIETRNLHINILPPTSLQLFRLFLPVSLVEKWVQYTKNWVTWLKDNDVVHSWKHPMGRTSNLQKWEGASVAEVYVWLGMLILYGYTGTERKNG